MSFCDHDIGDDEEYIADDDLNWQVKEWSPVIE